MTTESEQCGDCGHHIKSHWPDAPHECWGTPVGDCRCKTYRAAPAAAESQGS